MNHNEFNLEDDLIIPLKKFILQIKEEKKNKLDLNSQPNLNILEEFKLK
jgi:hypothetical protein